MIQPEEKECCDRCHPSQSFRNCEDCFGCHTLPNDNPFHDSKDEDWSDKLRNRFEVMVNYGIKDGFWTEEERPAFMNVCRDIMGDFSSLKSQWEAKAYKKGKEEAEFELDKLQQMTYEQIGYDKGYEKGLAEGRIRQDDVVNEIIEMMENKKGRSSFYDGKTKMENKIEVLIETPKFSCIKYKDDGSVDYISPFFCPFNYGSIPNTQSGDGDRADAVVLGKRIKAGSKVMVPVIGGVFFTDNGEDDPKIICSDRPATEFQKLTVMGFFVFYAFAKGILNRLRGKKGVTKLEKVDLQ